jgi:hypothetical protein
MFIGAFNVVFGDAKQPAGWVGQNVTSSHIDFASAIITIKQNDALILVKNNFRGDCDDCKETDF